MAASNAAVEMAALPFHPVPDEFALRPQFHAEENLYFGLRSLADGPAGLYHRREIPLLLEIIFERFIAKDQRLIVGHPITVEGQQVLELGRGNRGAQHANANQRPGIGLDEHLLRVGLNVVDSLLDGDVGPQTAHAAT